MSDRERSAVEETLAAWRAAERDLEEAPPDAPDRAARTERVHAARAAYQRAVVASQGRLDELEDGAARPWASIGSLGEPQERAAG